jgi:hypothetical protein
MSVHDSSSWSRVVGAITYGQTDQTGTGGAPPPPTPGNYFGARAFAPRYFGVRYFG